MNAHMGDIFIDAHAGYGLEFPGEKSLAESKAFAQRFQRQVVGIIGADIFRDGADQFVGCVLMRNGIAF